MPKVVKYGTFAPENVAVYLDALRNSRIGLVRHHMNIVFEKIHEGSLSWKKLRGRLSPSVRNLHIIFYILCNPNVFLAVCNFPYYRHTSGCYG